MYGYLVQKESSYIIKALGHNTGADSLLIASTLFSARARSRNIFALLDVCVMFYRLSMLVSNEVESKLSYAI